MSEEQVHKHPKNVAGKYYVIYEYCLVHGVCEHCACGNFKIDDDLPGAYVFKQHSTPKEKKECKFAFENCPVSAIRDDGDRVSLPIWDESNSI